MHVLLDSVMKMAQHFCKPGLRETRTWQLFFIEKPDYRRRRRRHLILVEMD